MFTQVRWFKCSTCAKSEAQVGLIQPGAEVEMIELMSLFIFSTGPICQPRLVDLNTVPPPFKARYDPAGRGTCDDSNNIRNFRHAK